MKTTEAVFVIFGVLGNVLSADGTFLFEGSVKEPVMAEIVAPDTRLRVPILVENSEFKVEANIPDVSTYVINGGGVLQQQRNELRKKESEIKMQKDSMRLEYEKIYGNDYFGKLQIRGLLSKMDERYNEVESDFVRQHDNLVGAAVVYGRMQTFYRAKRLHERYALLGENARKTVPGLLMKPYVDKESRIIVGGTAPDFKMVTPEGDSLSLYDIKAKVKILDFWASWCGPCRAEIPHLKEAYKEYSTKGVAFFSVSIDKDDAAWRKAMKEENMPWAQAQAPKAGKDVMKQYQFSGIPYILVIDKEGRILAKNLRGKALTDKLAELVSGKKKSVAMPAMGM